MSYYIIYWKNNIRYQKEIAKDTFFPYFNELVVNEIKFTLNNDPSLQFANIIITNKTELALSILEDVTK